MNEQMLEKAYRILFIIGGVFTAVLGMWFSKTGFGFEVPGYGAVGWGLAFLCIVVQLAFSSQLAYRSYNWTIFVCGIIAYIYSGWSNYAGIMTINPNAHPAFALILGEFIDWIAEPLIVTGLIGVSDNAVGDFFRNLFGKRAFPVKLGGMHQPEQPRGFSRPQQQGRVEYSHPIDKFRTADDFKRREDLSVKRPVGRPRLEPKPMYPKPVINEEDNE